MALLGRFEESEDALQKAADIDEKYQSVWYGLGVVRYLQGRYEEAEEALNKAVSSKSGARDRIALVMAILQAKSNLKRAEYHKDQAARIGKTLWDVCSLLV